MREKLSKLIKNYLKDYNMTQVGLADELGVHRETVSFWLKGERSPQYENLVKLEEFFNEDLGSNPDYAFYKGDELMAIGTLEEIAETTGIRYKNLKWRTYPSAGKHKLDRRYKENIYHLVKMEDEEDEG